MIALLNAQRGEAARRAGEVRGSPGWTRASHRLDSLNQQIMRLGSLSSAAGDPSDESETDDESRIGPRD
jgi:hypothetical protein